MMKMEAREFECPEREFGFPPEYPDEIARVELKISNGIQLFNYGAKNIELRTRDSRYDLESQGCEVSHPDECPEFLQSLKSRPLGRDG